MVSLTVWNLNFLAILEGNHLLQYISSRMGGQLKPYSRRENKISRNFQLSINFFFSPLKYAINFKAQNSNRRRRRKSPGFGAIKLSLSGITPKQQRQCRPFLRSQKNYAVFSDASTLSFSNLEQKLLSCKWEMWPLSDNPLNNFLSRLGWFGV